VKDVSVESVNHSAFSRRLKRLRNIVKKSGHAAYGARFGLVSVNDIRFEGLKLLEHLPDDDQIAQSDLSAHLGDDNRMNTCFMREVVHVALARRYSPRDKRRVKFRAVEASREPGDMFGRSANIETIDDAIAEGDRLVSLATLLEPEEAVTPSNEPPATNNDTTNN